MPIYEYACPKCGEFETTQRITDPPLKKCPTCKSKVQKLISSTSFQLKGSGWYATDYGGRKKGAAPEGGTAKESGTAKNSSAAGDGASGDGASKETGGETKSKEPAAPAKKEPAATAA
jgi:putative FmdB family regulatory protein